MNIYPSFIETKNKKIVDLLTLLEFKGYPVKGTDFTSFNRTKRFNKVYKLLTNILSI
jgi:hypothetical protein